MTTKTKRRTTPYEFTLWNGVDMGGITIDAASPAEARMLLARALNPEHWQLMGVNENEEFRRAIRDGNRDVRATRLGRRLIGEDS